MSSIIKILSNNYEYHNYLETNSLKIDNIKDIRFTKVLTKYSTEYNNSLFLQDLSKFLSMDKKDTISFFKYLRNNYSIENIQDILELYEINNLEINRIYRIVLRENKNITISIGGNSKKSKKDRIISHESVSDWLQYPDNEAGIKSKFSSEQKHRFALNKEARR